MKSSSKIIKVKQPIKDVVIIPGNHSEFEDEPYFSHESNEATSPFNEGSPREKHLIKLSEIEFQQTIEQQYLKGFQEGKEKGYQEGLAEIEPHLQQFQDLLQNMQNEVPALINQWEEALLKLLFKMVKKIVPVISEQQEKLIEQTLNKVLKEAQLEGRIKVYLHPLDLQTVRQMQDQFRKKQPDIKEVAIIEDATISRGGCVIETSLGKLDARIETQLNEMTTQLKKLYSKL